MHGATVHFPIALVLFSFTLDGAGYAFSKLAMRRGLHSAGYWSMLLGAAGTVPAVVSGLVMTKGVLLGHDTLRVHHLFAWPTFALIVGIAIWRALGRGSTNERPSLGYVVAVGIAAVLISATGYWGGEMVVGR
jgi:uncharacterized membrane protein